MKRFEILGFLFVSSIGSSSAFAPSCVSSPGMQLHMTVDSSHDAVSSFVLDPNPINSRRQIFAALGCVPAFLGFTSSLTAANALDMDAFINKQLESDSKNCDPKSDPKCIPQLTSDEALCKYGQSGNARADACKRVKAAGGDLPQAGSQGKSLGGAYAM